MGLIRVLGRLAYIERGACAKSPRVCLDQLETTSRRYVLSCLPWR